MHWRVIDVSTGDVLSEGDLNLIGTLGRLSGRSTVAVAGDTGEIVTIDVSTGDEQRRSTGLGAAVRWLDYSDDGELLVSGAPTVGSACGTPRRWTCWAPCTHPTTESRSRPAHSSSATATTWPSRRTTATVYRWETDLDRAIDFACQMAGRNLTEEEWEEFLPAQPYQSVCPDE